MRLSKAAGVVALLLSAFPAFAAQRTFVASTGNDANPCTRDMPCRSFGAALVLTNVSGEVVAIDTAGYGPFTATQAVSVISPQGVHAGVSVPAGDGITVNSSGAVVLRNLYVNGQGGTNGVNLVAAASLSIEGCTVANFSASFNAGILLAPASPSVVTIIDSVIRNNWSGITSSVGTNQVMIDRCRLAVNSNGLIVDGGAVTVRDSAAALNAFYGILVRGTNAAPRVLIESTVVAMVSGNSGVRVEMGNVTIHHGGVTGNTNGPVGYDVVATMPNIAKVTIDGAAVEGNIEGIRIFGDGASAAVSNCVISGALFQGILVASSAVARIAHNVITRNDTGLQNQGTVYTLGDNFIDGNTSADVSGTAPIAVTGK
jgi:hypothetical protein